MWRLAVITAVFAILWFLIVSCEKETTDIVDPDEFESSFLKAGAYNDYGCNYEAHLFNGSFFNAYTAELGYAPYQGNDKDYLADFPDAPIHWSWQYRNTELLMKWNDAWLSRYDLDEDGRLDRHHGFESYVGSGAWLTNHQSWWHEGTRYTYFVKIVAVNPGDVNANGYWYDYEGNLIGESIWGEFAIVQEVLTPGGLVFHPARPGTGHLMEGMASLY